MCNIFPQCSDRLTASVEDGRLSDEDGDGLADEGETISYTTTLQNTGNVRVKIVAVSHSLAQDILTCDKDFKGATLSQVKKALIAFVATQQCCLHDES